MKRRTNKVVIGLMAATMILGSVSTTVTCMANNYTDTAYDFYCNGDGSDWATKARNKMDNSDSYIRSTSGVHLSYQAKGKKGLASGQWGDPFVCDYFTSVRIIEPNKRVYFSNKCRNYGISTTYLTLASSDHKARPYKGVWSPDNCSGYGL